MAKYRIIGFDPASTRNIGWSVFALDKKPSSTAILSSWSGGTIVLPSMEEPWHVLWPMWQLLDAFIEQRDPHLIVIEKTSSFAGGFLTGQISQCTGVMLSVCGKHGVPVEFVYPKSVKKLVAGSGNAKKSAIKKAVRSLLTDAGIQDVKFHSEHTADAAASVFFWLMNVGVISKPSEEK